MLNSNQHQHHQNDQTGTHTHTREKMLMYNMASFAKAYNQHSEKLGVPERYRCRVGDWYELEEAADRGDHSTVYQISSPGARPVICAEVPINGTSAEDFALFCRADYPPNK